MGRCRNKIGEGYNHDRIPLASNECERARILGQNSFSLSPLRFVPLLLEALPSRYSPLPLRSKQEEEEEEEEEEEDFFFPLSFSFYALPPFSPSLPLSLSLLRGEELFVSAPGFVLPLLHFRHARFVDPASKQRDFLGPPFYFSLPERGGEREREREKALTPSTEPVQSTERITKQRRFEGTEPNLVEVGCISPSLLLSLLIHLRDSFPFLAQSRSCDQTLRWRPFPTFFSIRPQQLRYDAEFARW